MSRFQAQADAINSLRASLDEEALSMLQLVGDDVHFSITAPKGGKHDFLLTVTSGSGLLVCTNKVVPGLEELNAKLASRFGLGRAIALLGRRLRLDLDWAEDAAGGDSGDEVMHDQGSEGGSEGDAGDEGMDDEAIREWSRRLVAMERIERAMQEAEAEEEALGNAASLDALSQRQIFDKASAFRRLVNELSEIFMAQDFNLMADADEQGLYQWDVSLAGFRPDCPLAEDVQQAGRLFGLSSVQLQLTFKRGLHPFYPPVVRVISPRLQGNTFIALESHPLLKLESWDPTLSAKQLILHIKQFLEDNARVDLTSVRNAATGPRASAYLEAEHLLARLQALTGAPPAGPQGMFLHVAVPPRTVSPPSPAPKKLKSGEAKNAVAWKAGTGYGYNSGEGNAAVWDAKRAQAVQSARDNEVCTALECLAKEIRRCLGQSSTALDHVDLLPSLRGGCLAPLLVRELSSASFQHMCSRQRYYTAILACVDALCDSGMEELLAWHGEGDAKTVAAAVAAAATQAAHFTRVMRQSGSTSHSRGGASGNASGSATRPPTTMAGLQASQVADASPVEEDAQEVALATCLTAVADKVAAATAVQQAARMPPPPRATRSGRAVAAAAAASAAAASAAATAPAGPQGDEARYAAALSPFRCRILPGISANHRFLAESQREPTAPSKQRARRVGRELASLECDLPVTASSSIFVVADETNSVLWKAVITGPGNTPYEGGCFLFDIYFGADYPSRPPKVLIRTTGGGSVRFNPNLYNDGKVCLSLLGTWQAGKGESWSGEYSTILQVLVSIQSLILVDEPFYNEPGFEQRQDSSKSNAYSASVMENTVRWAMLDQLSSPPAYFADCIHAHFQQRGDAVLATVRKWVGWCQETGHQSQATNIEKMLPQLEQHIAKLKA